MTIQITTYNYWELIDSANQNGENVPRSNNSDIILKYPQQFGEGYLRYIPLRSGITLEIFGAEYREHLRIKNHLHRSGLSDDGKPSQSPMLHPQDVDRIHHAREFLIHNLDNPPSLIDLAWQVGLNERKLKHGFHQVFGTTAFGLMHEYRMEQAYQLLQNQQMTISGVATAIGYASPTSFTAAFKRKFGKKTQIALTCRNAADVAERITELGTPSIL